MQGGHIAHRLGGHARTIHHRGICDWLQEVAGVPAARHQAEQRLVRRGHLDHQTATWQPMHFTRRVGVDGLEGHTLQGGHVEHRFMLADFTVAAGFNNILAFQPCGIKQSRSASCEGIWITTRFGGHARVRTVEEFAAGFMLAFQMHGIKQNRGSSGEGVWIIKRKLGSSCKSCGKVMHRRRGLRSDDADSAILT